MTPPHMHMQVQVLFSAGTLPIRTVGDPGVQGAVVTGMQGMGVSTPKAAAVAAATAGLAGDMHIPKGGMFTSGWLSIMVPAGVPHRGLFVGNTFNVLGATPNGHINIAPETTSWGMTNLSV
jgi:hypothetical protein